MFDASAEQKITTLSKYVEHDSTIPTSDHSSVLMFTEILTLKQWELEMIPIRGNRREMWGLQKLQAVSHRWNAKFCFVF